MKEPGNGKRHRRTRAEQRELEQARRTFRALGIASPEYGLPDQVRDFLRAVTGAARERIFREALLDYQFAVFARIHGADKAAEEARARAFDFGNARTWEERFQTAAAAVTSFEPPRALLLCNLASSSLALCAAAEYVASDRGRRGGKEKAERDPLKQTWEAWDREFTARGFPDRRAFRAQLLKEGWKWEMFQSQRPDHQAADPLKKGEHRITPPGLPPWKVTGDALNKRSRGLREKFMECSSRAPR